MKTTVSLFLLTLVFTTASLFGQPVIYKVDPVHTGVAFKVRHFLNKVPGSFAEFEGEIHYDAANPGNSKAIGTIQVSSINTRNEDRDDHLQNEDFFHATVNPVISFESTKWTRVAENTYKVDGIMKMAGRERPITLDLLYLGEMEGRGKIRSGWEATTTIDRTDWGMTYGTPAVGTEVEIELNIQAHRQ